MSNRPTEIAELSFYTENKDEEYVVLRGEIISSLEHQNNLLSKMFDGKTENYFSYPKQIGTWYGLDLKEPRVISQIGFCPRNDSNDVEPNNIYELFYWNNGWKSLGRKMANSNNLVYKSVPKNVLFWLRNLTKGKEERIFTYEDSLQIWW